MLVGVSSFRTKSGTTDALVRRSGTAAKIRWHGARRSPQRRDVRVVRV